MLYMAENTNKQLAKQYAPDVQEDWIEKNLYSKFTWQGVGLMLILDVLMFGALTGLRVCCAAWIGVILLRRGEPLRRRRSDVDAVDHA